MGYNSTVIVLNDAVHRLTDKRTGAEFAAALHNAILSMHGATSLNVPIGNHVNGARVLSCRHADEIVLLAIGGNTGTELGSVHDSRFPHTKEAALEAAARILRFEGWTVCPPRRKKP